MASVKLVNVTKRYGEKEAVKNLSLNVEDKEFFVVAGPPGVGKTTLIRIIAGLERVDEGEVYIGEQLVNDIPPKDRDISIVFENLALYPNKTGFENIAFPLRMRKTPDAEVKSRVVEVARMLAIEHLLDRLPATYSGGELQRLAIARAIVRRPRVYLLDQPLANLDAKIREVMRSELKRLAKDLGQTIIFATHDQLEAMSMGDRVLVMKEGQVQQCDTPATVYAHPRNRFVANFIGSPSMNFIGCSYEEKGERAYLNHEAFTYDVTEFKEAISKAATSSELVLGIRPEHILIEEKPSKKEAVKATVRVTEPLGPEVLLHLRVGETPVRAITPVTFAPEVGNEVYMEFDRTKVHIFDSRTEQAIV